MGLKEFIFGAKTARRFTVDYSDAKTEKSNPAKSENQELRDYIKSDPELATAIRKWVNVIVPEMPRIVSVKNKNVALTSIDNYNQQLKDVGFYKIARNMVYSMIYSGNGFSEIKFSGKKLNEMYNIDSDTMEIKTNIHGEVDCFLQQVGSAPEVKFLPEEIVHLSLDNLQEQQWGSAFIESLLETLRQKKVAEDYINWLIQQNKTSPVTILKLKDEMTDDERLRFNNIMKSKESRPQDYKNIGMDIDESIETFRAFTFDDIPKILEYINTRNRKIYNTLMIPASLASQGDSDRSYSESQDRDFIRNRKAMQKLLIEELNIQFIKKLGWKDVEFAFNIITADEENELLKNASTLVEKLGFTQEAVVQYLRERGFQLPEVDDMLTSLEEQTSSDIDDAPSRQARDATGVAQNESLRKSDIQAGVNTDVRN